MSRRVALTITWLAVYVIASIAMSLIPKFVLWQCFVIILPAAAVLIGLAWTKPYPDFTVVTPAPGEPIEDLANPSRKVIWLDGPWEFRLEREKRWHRLDVPRPWNTVPGLKYYTGAAHYRRLARLPEGWSQGSVFLRFRGANYRTEVSIDGRRLGTHDGGSTPFEFEVTEILSDSRDHEIEVRIDNTLNAATVPNVVGWSNDGGILREVYLETRNPIHIDDMCVFAEPDMKGRAEVALILKIHNPKLKPLDYRLEILSPQGALIHEYTVDGWTMQTLQHRFKIQFVSLWSPENPALYRCRAMILGDNGDEMSFPLGIRSFTAGPEGLKLNGKSIRLRAVSILEDSPELGSTVTLSGLKKDLETVKAAGFNAIRIGPMPAHRKTLELCDRMGLLAMQEIPVWHTLALDLSDPGYQQSAESQLRELIMRDRNNPSLVAWGLANRIESDSSEGRWFVERLAGIARGLDDRPVYIVTSDPTREMCADIVDFLALEPESISAEKIVLSAQNASSLGVPTVVFLPGVPAHRAPGSRFAGAPDTEEHQAMILLDMVEKIDSHPAAAGWVVSSLTDHRDPGNFSGVIPFTRRHGLLSRDRKEKLACRVLADFMTENKREEIPTRRRRIPITTLSKIFAVLWLAASAIFFARAPGLILKLAYNPTGFTGAYPEAWRVALFITLFTALAWAILINRFFRSAPRVLLGSIDMPFLILLARVFRNEFSLFIATYLSLLWFWVLNTTILHFFIPGTTFTALLCMAAAVSFPDMIFAMSAFLRVPLPAVALAFNLWKLFLCFTAFGLMGTVSYVLIGPAAVILACALFVEMKFRIFKYIRRMF